MDDIKRTKIGVDVTVIMTTYNNLDFTKAAFSEIVKYYPYMRVIFADGGSTDGTHQWFHDLIELPDNFGNSRTESIGGGYCTIHLGVQITKQYRMVTLPHACTEECRNAAFQLVESPYVLFMDNDTKILDETAIEILYDTLNQDSFNGRIIAQTGAYAVKVISYKDRVAFVGTEFNDNMVVDAMPSYFSMHVSESYRHVGGMPKRYFYDIPSAVKMQELDPPGYSGDFSITQEYLTLMQVAITPKQRVPVLHWSQPNRNWNKPRPVEDWWYKNCRHIRCNPLNNWKITLVDMLLKKMIEDPDGFYKQISAQ